MMKKKSIEIFGENTLYKVMFDKMKKLSAEKFKC